MWDEYGSTSTITRLPEFTLHGPFFAIGSLFNMDTTDVTILIFIFCEFLAGISMYYASRYFLTKTYGKVDSETFVDKIVRCIKCNKKQKISGKLGEKITVTCPECNIKGTFFFSKLSESQYNIILTASIIAGLAYMWSFFMIYNYLYPFIRFAYAIAPFVVLFLIIGLERKKLKYAILTGFLWFLACTDLHWAVYGGILILSIILFYFILDIYHSPYKKIFQTFKTSLFLNIKYVLILVGSFICFSAYWFVTGFLMGGTSRYSAVINIDSFEFFYTESSARHAF